MPTAMPVLTSVDLALVGRPFTRDLALPLECEAAELITVDVTVLDPNNLAIPSRAVVRRRTPLGVAVTFTPAMPGMHHVTARFQPNLGMAQDDVLAAVDRGTALDAGRSLPAELASCSHLEITPGGLTLCFGTTVTVYDGPRPVQELSLNLPAVTAGGVIWSAGIERWVEGVMGDGGRGFWREPDERVAPPRLPALTGPTEDDVVVIGDDRFVHRVQVRDGGLVAERVGFASRDDTRVVQARWWRSGDTLLGTDVFAGCRGLDGGMQVCLGRFLACPEPRGAWSAITSPAGPDFVTLERAGGNTDVAVPDGLRTRGVCTQWNQGLVFSFEPPRTGEYVATWVDGVRIEHFDRDVHSAAGDWVFLRNPMRAVPRAP